MSLNNTPLQGAHINVVSGNFIIAQPLGVDDGVDYCHSGRIRRIDEEAIHRQLDGGAIVLTGPVAVSVTGESFNLTSEEIATQLAIKLKAEKMIGFCSSQGVTNELGDIVSELFPNEAQARVESLEAQGDYHSGTVRFLRGAVKACRSGVRRSHLISYQEDGALLQELFSRDGINAPEFFDKAVFSSLVLTLRDEGYISDSGDAEPEETMKVYQMLAELITSDVRLTIESATQGE
jgi:amino-acid N-acetyltransferase